MALKLSQRTDFRQSGPVTGLRRLNALVRDKQSENTLIDLGDDQVAFDPPVHVRESVHAALNDGRTGYTEAIGNPGIRNAVAGYYRQDYGLDITGEHVAVTTGAAGGLVLALLCFFSPGQRVGVAVPGAPEHRRALQALGLVPVGVPVRAADDYQITPGMLDALDTGIDGLIMVNPSNPAGGVADDATLAGVVDWCAQNGVRLFADETGHGLAHDNGLKIKSVLSHTDDAVVLGSFSRRFAMPGWRMGWVIPPAQNVRTIECLAQSLTVSPPTLPQFAGVEAIAHRAEMEDGIARIAESRDLVLERLSAPGFVHEGGGQAGLHMWLRLPEGRPDSLEFCTQLLEETGVYLRPGVEFDPDGGQRHIRLSYGGAAAEIAAGIDAITTWMEG